jgi:hypothetical protein
MSEFLKALLWTSPDAFLLVVGFGIFCVLRAVGYLLSPIFEIGEPLPQPPRRRPWWPPRRRKG